MMVWKD